MAKNTILLASPWKPAVIAFLAGISSNQRKENSRSHAQSAASWINLAHRTVIYQFEPKSENISSTKIEVQSTLEARKICYFLNAIIAFDFSCHTILPIK